MILFVQRKSKKKRVYPPKTTKTSFPSIQNPIQTQITETYRTLNPNPTHISISISISNPIPIPTNSPRHPSRPIRPPHQDPKHDSRNHKREHKRPPNETVPSPALTLNPRYRPHPPLALHIVPPIPRVSTPPQLHILEPRLRAPLVTTRPVPTMRPRDRRRRHEVRGVVGEVQRRWAWRCEWVSRRFLRMRRVVASGMLFFCCYLCTCTRRPKPPFIYSVSIQTWIRTQDRNGRQVSQRGRIGSEGRYGWFFCVSSVSIGGCGAVVLA